MFIVFCSNIHSYQNSSKNQNTIIKIIFEDFALDEHTFVVAIVTSNV